MCVLKLMANSELDWYFVNIPFHVNGNKARVSVEVKLNVILSFVEK